MGSESVTTTSSSSSSSVLCIQINNDTFPSLAPPRILTKDGNGNTDAIPKKFKNFKDAICASAPASAPAPSPTTQNQTRVLPNSAFPPPMVVKRDSEMYAKQMLAKTKNLAAAFYDDDDDGDDNIRDFGCSRSSKSTFINKYGNDDSD